MPKIETSRRVRILVVGGGKSRTNDNTGGPQREEDQSRYEA